VITDGVGLRASDAAVGRGTRIGMKNRTTDNLPIFHTP
jgi:hypothetical protein